MTEREELLRRLERVKAIAERGVGRKRDAEALSQPSDGQVWHFRRGH